MNRLGILLAAGVAAVALQACLPDGTRIPQSPFLPTLERKAGLIAYLGRDGNVYTLDQGGGRLRQQTDDALLPEAEGDEYRVYRFPTWSPDGASLAYVGLYGKGSETASELYVAGIEDEAPVSVYQSQHELPFYLFWAPDSAVIGIATTTASGQTQAMQTVTIQGVSTLVDTGTPFFWSWAPNSETVIVHAVEPMASLDGDRLAFVRLAPNVVEYGLDLEPAAFAAPAWSADGNHILLAAVNAQRESEIMLLDSEGNIERSIAAFEGETALAWASDSTMFAYLAGEEQSDFGALGPLHVVDLAARSETMVDEQVIAFFWSPNGQEIAYFVPYRLEDSGAVEAESATIILALNVLDVGSMESRELLKFQPTNQFAEIIPFFDQHHQSSTIWSPDSNNIVLSFLDDTGGPSIAVIAASGTLEPRYLAEGVFAVWSWK
jgi:TolB protein